MNKDLAVLIPGLTYAQKWSSGEKQDRYEKRFDTIKRTFDDVKFYIHTWEHEYNDYDHLLNELTKHKFDYELIDEKYEDIFDNTISDYIKNLESEKLKLWEECSNYKTNWNDIDFLRRHFSIYYKFYKNYKMIENQSWILRIKSNNIFHMNLARKELDTLINTYNVNDGSDFDHQDGNILKRELGAASIIKSYNTLFCSISDVNIHKHVKINENAIFGHRNTWDNRVFGQYSNINEYLENILEVYFDVFRKDHETNPLNNYPHPAVGSMVWSEYFIKQEIMLLSRVCNSGPQNRDWRKSVWY